MEADTPSAHPSQSDATDETTPLTRRHFLQTAGIVGAGLTLAPHVAAQSALREHTASSPQSRSGPPNSDFDVRLDAGAIVSLKYAHDTVDTDYIAPRARLGDAHIAYRRSGASGEWRTVDTTALADARSISHGADGASHETTYEITDGGAPALTVQSRFAIEEHAITWTVTVRNRARHSLEVGDLAFPLPMANAHRHAKGETATLLKHSFISGHGSFLFWMRSNSVGPYLTTTPLEKTSLEYWESGRDGYRVYVHSAAAGAVAREHGCHWRQPNTSVTLAPAGKSGDARSYAMKLQWAQDYDAVRQLLVDNGLIDVHVVPGMTVPSDLFARFALRTTQHIERVESEFPHDTKIKSLGTKGDVHLYEVRFAKLGENRLTVRFGHGRHMHLEFFATEPLETLIKKRAAFIATHQFRDPSKWYNGLLAEWDMDNHVMPGPDNYDRIKGWRIYEVTCDDPGLSRPAFLAAKNAEHPVQREVEALDYYIQHFVWGGLQRTTEETFAYGIYGIPDWKRNRESHDTGRNGQRHLWRIYDYPHITLMYFGMYRVAKHRPEITCALSAHEYLRRAYGTAVAMFTIPYEIERWSAYQTGLYNELVIVQLIDALYAEGMTDEAERLRMHWERKVTFFVSDKPDLFASEYAFDSTGFESTHALAKYAVQHVARMQAESAAAAKTSNTSSDDTGSAKHSGLTSEKAKHFMETQIAANIFCRGWLEPAYYYLGSDYRGGAGDRYTLTYMSQMGGWSVLDYALHFAADPHSYLRLGYASYLSAWALVNSGTPESNYGFWYPGEASDGGAGGGFEPAAYGMTWLEQPHHRGSWYYSCEINLGYCGALRSAATVLADDPIFGRFCYGGEWRATSHGVEIVPRDGVRRRLHAMVRGGTLHLESDTDRFAASSPIVLAEDLSELRFHLESDNPAAHVATMRLSGVAPGRYFVSVEGKEQPAALDVREGREVVFEVPVNEGARPTPVVITRSG